MGPTLKIDKINKVEEGLGPRVVLAPYDCLMTTTMLLTSHAFNLSSLEVNMSTYRLHRQVHRQRVSHSQREKHRQRVKLLSRHLLLAMVRVRRKLESCIFCVR